jgi:hypothetical protein
VWYFIFFIFKITQCCFISSFPGGHSPIFFSLGLIYCL